MHNENHYNFGLLYVADVKVSLKGCQFVTTYIRARKIFEFHLAHWANNPEFLLAQDTSPFAQVFKLINNS